MKSRSLGAMAVASTVGRLAVAVVPIIVIPIVATRSSSSPRRH
jgi:hypothetical protein